MEPYNPAKSEDGVAAKTWELLRRNPKLRSDAKELLSRLENIGPQGIEQTAVLITRDIRAPLAAFVFRWLLWPTYYHFRRTLIPGRKLFAEDNITLIEEAIAGAREQEANQPVRQDSELILNTPWPDMPPLFQLLFRAVADEFEFWNRNHLEYLKRPVRTFTLTVDELKRIVKGELVSQETLVVLADYDFFAVPRVVLTQSQQREIKQKFARFLKCSYELGKIITDKKTQNLFGSAGEWEAFVRIYPAVDWDTNLGSKKGMKEFLEWDRKAHRRSRNSEMLGPVKAYWKKMLDLMLALYTSEASYAPLLLRMLLPKYRVSENDSSQYELPSRPYNYRDMCPPHQFQDFFKAIPYRMFQKVRSLWEVKEGLIDPLRAQELEHLTIEILEKELML